jgi:periplasmic divalent cation tolerance protein
MDNRETIEKIGRRLLEKRLISCVQIMGPIKSIYRWKGRIEEKEEWLCVMKSRTSFYKVIEREIKRLHTYEVPEIMAIEIDSVLPEYLRWVMEETIIE